jgi:isocitrate/isopropylmalate dehydrogenase
MVKIAVLPGDDIGPEITDAAVRVAKAASDRFGLALAFETHEVGMASHRRMGTTLPDAALAAARAADGIILGPAGMTAYPPREQGGINVPGTVRKQLELFANLRPARSRAKVARSHPGLDLMIVRENTEGFYADRSLHQGYGEFMPTAEVAMSVRVITARASRRIAEEAFRVAETRRRHVTMVGKRHVLQMTDGLFMREVEAVAAKHPDVTLREVDVDAMAAELYTHPESFDVVLTTNMFGDILSNQAVALSGGLGLAGSLNAGHDHAAANAGHGSAPDIAAKGIANPAGLILSTALLLGWLGRRGPRPAFIEAGRAIDQAIDRVLEQGVFTRDLGGNASTRSFTDAVIAQVESP